MRLWHTLVVAAFFTLACGDMGGMVGGDDAEQTDDADDTDEAEDEEDDAEEDEEDEADDNEEDEEEEDEKVRVEKKCTVQAFKSANGSARLKGNLSQPKCAGRWGAVTTSGGRAVLEFDGDGWSVRSVGSCKGPTNRICQVLGFK